MKKTLKRIAEQTHAFISLASLAISTSLCTLPIFVMGFFKLFPNKSWRIFCSQCIDRIGTLWCSFNNFYTNKIQRTQWQISGVENLNTKAWYLVIANHQSWLDIVILHKLFNKKIPMLKFFVKDQLKWVPLLGFCWWAMGFPFMKRYSKEYLAKNPHKQGKDLIATNKAITLFKQTPASIMNFIEGTRFSPNKKAQQQSPYQHLLKPKAGGISFVISAMGKQLTDLLDVTIVYSDPKHSLWDFLCRRVRAVKVNVRSIPIPEKFRQPDLLHEEQTQSEFKAWLNQHWIEKDNLIASLKGT